LKGLSGKTAFITGASSGIGAALAREFARNDCHVALAARRQDRLGQVAREIEALGRRAVAIRCDVRRDEDVAQAVEAARREFGSIDVVVANAGFGILGDLEELSLSDYRDIFETNFFGVLRTIYAALDDLKRASGRLVIVGSMQGYISPPGASAYSTTKFAIKSLADAIAPELRKHGVSVTLISPGLIESEIRTACIDRRRSGPRNQTPDWLAMSADRAARKIVRAAARRRRELIVTGHGHVLLWISRLCPWLLRLLFKAG